MNNVKPRKSRSLAGIMRAFGGVAFCILIHSTGSAQKSKEGEMTIPEYISKYSVLAREEMRRVGIPASITLAQGILESSYGNSKLAVKANNHFGIKCGNNWEGPTYIQDDDERRECFRKYESVLHSFKDHSNFLIGKERYAHLFKLSPKDYKGWANGLQKAGYATNPNYASLLIRLIEERNLHQFDTEQKYVPLTAEEEESLKSMDNKFYTFNGIKTVISQPNEMAIDIAMKYDIPQNLLLHYNDMKEGDYIPPGTKIYLEPKKNKGYEVYHRVADGENMHTISQKQGIRLKALYKKNRMTWGQEPATGEILCLQKKCAATPRLKTEAEIKKDIQQNIQKRIDDAVEKQQQKEDGSKNKPVQTEAPKEKAEPVQRESAEKDEPARESMAESISAGTAAAGRQPKYHKVAYQETIYKICSRYKVSAEDIRRWNGLTSNTLREGQLLIVGYTSNLAEEVAEDDIRLSPLAEGKDETVVASSSQKKPKYHTVAPQETLYRISTIYKVTVDDLKKWNHLSSHELFIGQQLIVGYETAEMRSGEPEIPEPEAGEIFEEQPAPAVVNDNQPSAQPTYHRVQEGETLYTIAQKYKLNVEALKKLNNLITNDIRPGQVLKLR